MKLAGSSACGACGVGRIAPEAGARNCTDCPVGRAQGAAGQSSCAACLAGFYAASPGSSSCAYCPGDYASDEGARNCSYCAANFFYNDGGACTPCPTGTVCADGDAAKLRNLHLLEGYWRISAASLDVLACPSGAVACVGGSGAEGQGGNGYCAEGHFGPLCQVCRDLYYYNPDSERCVECAKVEANAWLLWSTSPTLVTFTVLFIVLVAAFVYVAFLATSLREVNKRVEKGTKFHKVSGGVGLLVLHMSSYLKGSQVKFKVLASFVQIASQIGFNCSISFPSVFEAVMVPLRVFNLQFLPALGLQ